MLKIVVLISGHGSNLQAIIDALESRNINAKITAIISNKANAAGLERARKHGIPAYVISKQKNQPRDEYDLRLGEVLDRLDPDLIVLAGFMRILSSKLVNQFRGKMINIHPSLLPKYRGTNTHERVLTAKESEHGCSIHFVTPELDGGPVIAQAKFVIKSNDNTETLSACVQQLEHKLYPLIIEWFSQNRIVLKDELVFLDGTVLAEPYLMV
jgi:phosphoribosylglycinamide formyltransferase-1